MCRHTCCSDIGAAINTDTPPGLEAAKDGMILMEERNAAEAEIEKTTGENL